MLKDRKILVTGATGQIAGPIAENFAKDNEEMGEYVAELTGVATSFVESPISFDSFPADNTYREMLIGKCSVHWKDGVRDTFDRIGII